MANSANASACQKSLFAKLVGGGVNYPQFAMVGSLRSQSSLAALPCLLGLLRAASPTGRALRAPPPYTPPGTIKARKGFGSTIRNSRLAALPLATLLCSLDFRFACFAHCARRSSVPLGARFVRPRHCHPQFAMVVPHLRTALAFGGAVFRGCALRFASCARHSSPSGLRCAALPCSLGLLRPVSATGGGLRAPPSISFR